MSNVKFERIKSHVICELYKVLPFLSQVVLIDASSVQMMKSHVICELYNRDKIKCCYFYPKWCLLMQVKFKDDEVTCDM